MRSKEAIRYRRSSLGGGLTFVPIEVLHAEFKDAGMSLSGFRMFLKHLHVPVLYLGKKTLVRVQSFRLALLKISRIGEKDFYAPGSEGLRRDMKVEVRNGTRMLDVDSYRKDMTQLIAELLYCKAASGTVLTEEVAKLASETVERMIQAGMMAASLRTQALYDRENVKRAKTATGKLPYDVMRELNLDKPTGEENTGDGD